MESLEFQQRMLAYFAGERRESILFLLVGAAALLASAYLFRSGGPYRGMLVPLALIGLVQLAVGGSILARTPRQVADLAATLERSPEALKATETTRMTGVMRGFQLYKWAEIAVLALGIALTFLFTHGSFWHAVGIGCIAQAALMLVLDLFAEGRGHAYLAALERLSG